MRGPLLTPIGRTAAIVVLVAVIVTALVAASRGPSHPAMTSVVRIDLGGLQLDRCRGLGPDSERDAACQAAWRRLRQHFFGHSSEAIRP